MAGLDPIGVIPPGALIGPTGGIVDGLRMYDRKLNLYDIDNVWVSLSPSEFRVVVPDYATTPGGDFGITFENGSAVPIAFDIGEIGLYDVTDKTVKAPPSYVDSHIAVHTTANGNTVVNNGLVEAEGAPWPAEVPQVSMQPARTTLIAWSRDLTNAAWTEAGTNVAALDAVGMDGAANSACTLTDNDGAANERLEQSRTVSANTNPHTARVFIAKDGVTSRFSGLDLDLSTGGARQRQLVHLNTSTGATASAATEGAGGAFEANSAGDRWELLIEVANVNNTVALTGLRPADGAVLGTQSTAATGSAVYGNVEFYENKTIEQIRGTAPIFTGAAAVSVDNDGISFPGANVWMPLTEGLALFALTSEGDWAQLENEQYFRDSASSIKLLFHKNNAEGLSAQGPAGSSAAPSTQTAGAEAIAATIFSAELNELVVGVFDGSAWAWDATPANFTGWVMNGSDMTLGFVHEAAHKHRSTLIYDGLPAGSETLADVQAWVEANAESEILKRQS